MKVRVTPPSPVGVRIAARLLERHHVWLSAPAHLHAPLRSAIAEHLGHDPGDRLSLLDHEPDLSLLDEVWHLSPPGPDDLPTPRGEAAALGVRWRRFEVAPVAAGPGAAVPDAFATLVQALDRTVAEVAARSADYFEHHAVRCTLPEEATLLDAESAASAVMALADADADGGRVGASRPGDEPLAGLIGDEYDVELVFGAEPSALAPVDRLFESRIGEESVRSLGHAAGGGAADGGAEPAGADAVTACVRAWRRHFAEARRAEERRLAALLEAGTRRAPGGPEFRVFGEGGETVVIVNAIAQGLGYWTRLIDRLALDHRVVIWALRTEGEGGEAATMEDHARDLDAIVREAADGPAHLVGWCSGPKICLRYAAEHPERVASLTFVAGTYRGLGDPGDTEYQTNLERVFTLLERSPGMAESVRTVLAESVASAPGPSTRPRGLPPGAEVLGAIDPRLRTLVMAPYGTGESTLSYARQIMGFWRCAIDDAVPAVGRPALIVGAELDQIASPGRGRDLAGALPDARFVELPGATHYCMFDRPDEVAALIRQFITSVAPRPALHLQPQEA